MKFGNKEIIIAVLVLVFLLLIGSQLFKPSLFEKSSLPFTNDSESIKSKSLERDSSENQKSDSSKSKENEISSNEIETEKDKTLSKTKEESSIKNVENSQKSAKQKTEVSASKVNEMSNEEIISELESSNWVKDLPSNSFVSLGFYRFNKGERIWDKKFTINGNKVSTGKKNNPDIFVWIHSDYLTQLKKESFCNVAGKAKKNKELGYSFNVGKTKLLWKYGSFYYSHKDCF